MSSNLITRSIFLSSKTGGHRLETLYRWSKSVDEEDLEEWETRLLIRDVAYSAEKQVKRKRWQLSSFLTSREQADLLRAEFGGGVAEVKPGDWQPSAEAGADSLLKIRDSLLVTESQDEVVLANLQNKYPGRILLSFPPQLAFGTGGHPTTAGCLRFLVDLAKERVGRPWRVLDLGCGSGILAVAAAKLGASEVIAVEIDEMALGYARRNADRHEVGDQIQFIAGDVIPMLESGELGQFDVLAANLFSSLLVELLPSFPAGLAEGGEIVISGFLTSQAREVAEAAKAAGLPLKDFLRRGKWVAGHGRR
ncbi:MAG: 50S ribosomal protein L11 methyltransferase [Verrucomicrobiales bacterium]|nr:50S ribosomal protein L11 methyltransferase [Verrucomicrobiales bacterium]